MESNGSAHPKIVAQAEWLEARKALLVKEKALKRQQDALAAERRRLPMVKIDKDYVFEGSSGKLKLIDLFEGRKQLIIYHFMFDPNDPPEGKSAPWSEGCPGCSFVADNIPKHLEHLNARNTSFTMISRAPLAKIKPFKQRMGWTMPWVSSFGSDFNYDFHVTADENIRPIEYNYADLATLRAKGFDHALSGEQPGLSVFLRLGDEVYHTYSTYARGLEPALATTMLLDMTPFGRQETWEDSPDGWPKTGAFEWLKHHDKYEHSAKTESCCHSAGVQVTTLK